MYIPSKNAVRLEKDLHRLFDLPPLWPGRFSVEQTGLTYNTDFKLKLNLIKANGEIERTFNLKGPILYSGTQPYYLDQHQFKVIEALDQHSKLRPEEKGEIANLFIHVPQPPSD